jgi:hypothetical protein
MDMLKEFWFFIETNSGALGFTLAFVTGCWGVWNYFNIKKAEEETRQFQAFHLMIKGLVMGEGHSPDPYVDQQLAVIYELRNFPQYYPVTLRILERSKKSWRSGSGWWGPTLIAEADLTIEFIKRKSISESHYLKTCWYLPNRKG